MSSNLDPLKQIPILDVANRLGIEVKNKSAMCFGGHDKKSRSLSFTPDANLWHCFGCGKGGGSIKLVQEVLKVDFSRSLDWFADIFNVDVRTAKGYSKKRIFTKRVTPVIKHSSTVGDHSHKEFAADPELYKWFIGKCGEITNEVGIKYMKSHGISMSVAKRLGVRELLDPERAFHCMVKIWGTERVYRSGLAWGKLGKPERLIWTSYTLLFPVLDGENVVYLQGRLFRGDRKFINLRGVETSLYNVNSLRELKQGSVIHICEGAPDVLAMLSQKVPAVAVLGASSFKADWVRLFLKFDVVVVPDGDNGGETLKRSIKKLFSSRGKGVRFVKLPVDKDVADVIAEMDDANE